MTADALPPGGHQTWNVCPSCGHTWVDKVSTPGVVHRTKLCAVCWTHEAKDDEKKTQARVDGVPSNRPQGSTASRHGVK
jgi:hypothetical protein